MFLCKCIFSWSILSITLSTSEALRDDWDRRYRKIKIIIIIINVLESQLQSLCFNSVDPDKNDLPVI